MNSTDTRRFGGISRLYGGPAQEALSGARICVVGLGGVGSWCVEALARTGIGQLALIDGDCVAESNVNRQLPALSSTIGLPKADVLAQRVRDINPNAQVCARTEFVSEENFERLVGAGDVIVDAIDSLSAKTALLAWAHAQGRTIITSGGAGGRVDPALITAGDLARAANDALLSKVRASLRKHHGFPRGSERAGQSRPFGIRAVYSTEAARGCAADSGATAGAGFGTAVVVTASMGMRLAAEAIAAILGWTR